MTSNIEFKYLWESFIDIYVGLLWHISVANIRTGGTIIFFKNFAIVPRRIQIHAIGFHFVEIHGSG